MKVFINPGHDIHKDSGAVNPNSGLRESDVALSIGELVQKYLETAGIDTVLWQNDSLSNVCRAANDSKADIFVSIHCNAANTKARGTETFYLDGSDKGKTLATCIQKQLISSIRTTNRGIKTAGYYVLKYTDMPAVLVETAFIDNDSDARLLTENEDDFARAIARGVTDFQLLF